MKQTELKLQHEGLRGAIIAAICSCIGKEGTLPIKEDIVLFDNGDSFNNEVISAITFQDRGNAEFMAETSQAGEDTGAVAAGELSTEMLLAILNAAQPERKGKRKKGEKIDGLTGRQMEQQDAVDNTIWALITSLDPSGKEELDWDIEPISEIREIVQEYLIKHGRTTEMEFYPYIEGSNT